MKRKLNLIDNKEDIKIPKLVIFGPSFRKKLKTDEAINALKEFVSTNKQRDVITEYVNSGGNAKELVGLLKQFDGKKDTSVANAVFSALHALIVKAVDDLLLIQKSVEEACEEVLCTYQNMMQNMLNSISSTTSHRKVILKLLSAMVTLSNGLAKKILALFPVSPKVLKMLTDSRHSNSTIKLRVCFIHYLLSFLITENTVIISELLQKKGLLTSIIPGLMKDSPEIVILVLTTFRTKIIENIKIPKTLKMHTFNTLVLRSLFKLYDYGKLEHSDKNSNDEENDLSFVVESIREATHLLLVLLCTSTKKGILFRERNLVSGKNPNQLILTLLEDIDSAWKDELKSMLVTEILKICPEFIKNIFSKVGSHLQPSISVEWIKLVTFLKQIVEKQELNIESANEQQAFDNIASLTFPSVIQKLLREFSDEMIHPHPIIRYQIISLLVVLLRKTSTFFKQFTEIFSHDQNFFLHLKEEMEQFLNKNLISSLQLINAWNAGVDIHNTETIIDTTDSNLNLDVPELIEYYLSLADLLLLYNDLCPMSFNQLRMDQNLSMIHIEVGSRELLFKQARLIFHIYNLKPGQERFSFVMKQFVDCYVSDENFVEDVLTNVLRASNFFDGFEEEITIWLYSLKKINFENSVAVADLFIDVLNELTQNSKKFVNDLAIIMVENNEELFTDYVDVPENLVDNVLDTNEECEQISKSYISLSPVVPALLSTLKSRKNKNDDGTEAVKSFTLRVLVHLLHSQSNYRGLMMLVQNYNSVYIDSHFLDYINFWNHQKYKPEKFVYPLVYDTVSTRLCRAFVNDSFDDEVVNDITKITETERVLVWNMCIFYVVQLNSRQKLNDKNLEKIISTFDILRDGLELSNKMLCLKSILTNPNFINNFHIKHCGTRDILSHVLLKVVLNFYQKCDIPPANYAKLLSPYRLRLILFLLNKMDRQENIAINKNEFKIESFVEFVMLPTKTAVYLLEMFIRLPVSLLIEGDSLPSEWISVITYLLKIIATSLEVPLENESILLLISKIADILKLNIVAEKLEESLIVYLQCFPHHLHAIPEYLVQKLIQYHPTLDKLALYLLPYYPACSSSLQNKITQCAKTISIELLFDTLRQFEAVSNVQDTLSILYENHLRHKDSWLNTECSWLKINLIIVVKTLQDVAEKEHCSALCKKIETEWPDIKVDENVCAVFKVIFEKADENELFVRLLISKLNEMLTTAENTNWLCSVICNIGVAMGNLNFLLSQESWKEFIKLSLKISLQTFNSTLMRTLKVICNTALTQNEVDEIVTIFQMTISHSEFINIMLADSDVKCELVELLLILTAKNTSLMSSNHVPLLLGAYKATLSKSDQLLLQILQWYEENGIRFSDCRPYLWGDAAVTHHSIRTEISVSLKRQPQPNQVLELLDMNIVKNTIKYLPLDRSLQPGKRLHHIETEIYDLSFMLPLMSHLLAPESRISVQKFTRSGGLSLILAALASEVPEVRMAAFHCLQRFHSHLSSREKEIQLWDHFLNAIKNGVLQIRSKNEENDIPPKLACIVATFLAHMCLIISEPLHSLYVPLTNFLLAKEAFDVNTIPNFLVLYYSTDIKYREHQEWILRVIRDGMRNFLDWRIVQKTFLFKLLQQYCFTPASNETINILILDILAKALQIQECKLYLVTKCGFLSWNLQILRSAKINLTNALPLIISILKSLMSVKNSSSVIITTLLLLRKVIGKKVSQTYIEDLLLILSTMYCSCKEENLLTEYDVENIIKFARPHLDAQSEKMYKNCLKFKSVIGVNECDKNVNNYTFRIVRQFVHNIMLNK